MITHIVMFRWKPELPDGQLARDRGSARRSAARHPVHPLVPARVRSRRVGRCERTTTPIVATFDDVDGWRRYDTDPVHEAARADVIRPWIAERAAVQFES